MGRKKKSNLADSISESINSSKVENKDSEVKHQEEVKVANPEVKKDKGKSKKKKEKANIAIDSFDDEKKNKKGLLKLSWVINVFCAVTPIICVKFMVNFDNFSIGSWLFTTMFSFYCLLGLLKQCIFPDNFEERVTIIEGVIISVINGLYFYPGYQMYSRNANNNPSNERIACSMLLMTFGMFLVMSADCQKYFTLHALRLKRQEAEGRNFIEKAEDRPLITEGMFSWTRNPNYLGEIMVFSSFCNITNDCTSWAIYFAIWILVFGSRMLEKDKRLKKKKGWEEYFKRTWMLIPKISTCWLIDLLIYLNILMLYFIINVSGGIEQFIKNVLWIINHEVVNLAEIRQLITSVITPSA